MPGGPEGKTVLVTGGGTGIGRACALALADAGCRVAVAGRRVEKLRETAAASAATPAIECVPLDVADRAAVEAAISKLESRWGRIDVLVNSAGVNVRERAMDRLAPEDWDRLLRINASGAFHTMQAVLPGMRERRDGVIVNISSVAGRRALTLAGVAYCASKFAMSALGTVVGLEEAERGVRVTNVYPGEVNTPILDDRPEPVSEEHRARILQPEDVAAAVALVVGLPPRAHIPDLVIKPTTQAIA